MERHMNPKLSLKSLLVRLAVEHTAFVALLAIVLVAVAIFPSLASVDVLLSTVRGYSIVGVVALGMTFVILTSGIDLSVGSIAAVSGFSAAVLTNHAPWIPVIVPVLAGTALGAVNGFTITKLRVPPFIATLAMQMGARGMSLIISGEKPIGFIEISKGFTVIGQGETLAIPNLVWIFGALSAVCVFVAKWTRFGRSVYAVGGNEEAARMMGFSPVWIKFIVYTFSGFCAGLAGMMLTSRLSSAQTTAGIGWELTAIASVVLGGTLLTGGKGRVSGTICGIIIYAVVEVLLGRFSLMVWWINIFTGALVFLVIIMQSPSMNMRNFRRWFKAKGGS
jgi:ribose transport system permease protein